MGWEAYYRDGTVLREEDGVGRPVNDGEEGNLAIIAQKDFGHYVGVDLDHGIIFIDLEKIERQGDDWYFVNFRSYFWITEETNTVGAMEFMVPPTPDEAGWYIPEYYHCTWRPIWFTRVTNGDPTKVIGCQTTLPDENEVSGKNVKKLICLFSDGRLGIN
jgi:hypothetical protein